MINKEKFAELAQKYLDGTATSAEKNLLEQYYDAFKGDESIYQLVDKTQVDKLKAAMFHNIQAAIGGRTVPMHRSYLRYAAIAASLLFAGVMVTYLVRNTVFSRKNEQKQLAMTSIQADSLREVVLNDGTIVWLNTESKLELPSDFGQKTRDVYLKGEAYFEVKSDPAHPFMVHTEGLTTHVLGTKFNVKAYNTKAIEVTLVEGKVMLTAAGQKSSKAPPRMDTMLLLPNEKAVYTADLLRPVAPPVAYGNNHKPMAVPADVDTLSVSLSKHVVANALDVTLWRAGELVFDQEPLDQVLETLSRRLHVTIKADTGLENLPVTLKVRDEPLDKILFEITKQVKRKQQAGTGAQYKKLGSEYYIE